MIILVLAACVILGVFIRPALAYDRRNHDQARIQ